MILGSWARKKTTNSEKKTHRQEAMAQAHARRAAMAAAAAMAACGCLPGTLAFAGGHACTLGRGRGLAPASAAAPPGPALLRRRPPPPALSLCRMQQNAPGGGPPPGAGPDVVGLFVKSQPSSREGIDLFVGEDAAVFDWADEKMGALGERGWLTFFAAVGAILSALAVLWIYPATGYSDDFVAFLEDLTGGNSHLVTLIFGIIFPVMHSGLASLRPYGEKVVGARTWRVIFAWPSLCLAYSWITYFISHAHDGIVLWDGAQVGWLHAVAWVINFASFFFLYPSVFNLKEVAAVDIPKVHLWETGIMRITRHPQFVVRFFLCATPSSFYIRPYSIFLYTFAVRGTMFSVLTILYYRVSPCGLPRTS